MDLRAVLILTISIGLNLIMLFSWLNSLNFAQ